MIAAITLSNSPGERRDFSQTFQTGPGAHPASYTMDTGSSGSKVAWA